jgi:hypothetical protein
MSPHPPASSPMAGLTYEMRVLIEEQSVGFGSGRQSVRMAQQSDYQFADITRFVVDCELDADLFAVDSDGVLTGPPATDQDFDRFVGHRSRHRAQRTEHSTKRLKGASDRSQCTCIGMGDRENLRVDYSR